jgi:hypothetical protein
MNGNINNMTKEAIVDQLKRLAYSLNDRYNRDREQAKYGFKSSAGAIAIGRQEVCASILDDFAITFGITADKAEH